MKLALAVLAAVLLTAGCGQSNTRKDPFEGTWQAVGFSPGNGIAISKVSGATYHVTEVDHFKQHWSSMYLRRGNELVSTQKQPVDTLDFNQVTGRLTWAPNTELSKVSDSTPPPSPWPTTSP